MLHFFHLSYIFLSEVLITEEILNVPKPETNKQARLDKHDSMRKF